MLEYKLITIARALVEVAGYALIGQGLLHLLAGASRETNFAYQMLSAVTRPVIGFARCVSPRIVADRHVGLVAFFLLFWAWIALTVAKRYVCVTAKLAC
jgi:hypothetical protein